jgi:hypothetical protein
MKNEFSEFVGYFADWDNPSLLKKLPEFQLNDEATCLNANTEHSVSLADNPEPAAPEVETESPPRLPTITQYVNDDCG